MAAQASDFWPVAAIVSLFEEAGCELRTAEPTVRLENGDCLSARYLLAPDKSKFAPMVDLADDDKISELEVRFWERRLGINIPRPVAH